MTNGPEALKAIRKARNLSQRELGQSLGVTQACIQRYEAGLRQPELDIAQQMESLFGIAVSAWARLPQPAVEPRQEVSP